MRTTIDGSPLYICDSCGSTSEVLHEIDDYTWVCDNCRKIYNDDLINGLIELDSE